MNPLSPDTQYRGYDPPNELTFFMLLWGKLSFETKNPNHSLCYRIPSLGGMIPLRQIHNIEGEWFSKYGKGKLNVTFWAHWWPTEWLIDKQNEEQTGRWKDRRTDRWRDRWRDRWTDRLTDRWTDRWTDSRWTNRLTLRMPIHSKKNHIHTHWTQNTNTGGMIPQAL